jgi:intein-encoded DNA endonuclease-like protein
VPIYKKVNKNFFKKWTPEMAYVLGFFSADGYITVNRRGGQFWCIQIGDKLLLEEIKKTVQAGHKIGIRQGKINKNVMYRLQIGSIEMCDDLRGLGLTERKTKNLALSNVPQKYFAHFVRGYFDGDGNVWVGVLNKKRKKPTKTMLVAFTSESVNFLRSLLYSIQKSGIEGGSIYKVKGSNCWRLNLSTRDALKLYEIMYNVPQRLFLERKKSVFEKFIKMRL